MSVTYSAMVARLSESRGKVAPAVRRALIAETLERGRPVAYRAAPLDFSDIAVKLEDATCRR